MGYLLVELFGHFAAWRQSFLSDENSALRVECCGCEHDMLGAISKLLLSALGEEGEDETNTAGENTLEYELTRGPDVLTLHLHK